MKNFLKIFSFRPLKFTSIEDDLLWLIVECGKCGERIRVRINKKTDLQNEFRRPGGSGSSFTLKKEVMGNNCYNLMEVYLEFNDQYRILSKRVKNGKLLSP